MKLLNLIIICLALFGFMLLEATEEYTEFMAQKSYLLPEEAEVDLQANPDTVWQKVLAQFKEKGGTFLRVGPDEHSIQRTYPIQPGDVIYPVCSGGFCRSQTLWILLSDYVNKITLFAPHAARLGYDPYNGQLNWHRNDAKEQWRDEFQKWAGRPKIPRFGYAELESMHALQTATAEELAKVADYYNAHYFGPGSCQKGQKRVYITFEKNAHVVMLRLNQSNESLDNVVVVHIALKDIITTPLPEWNTFPRSRKAYNQFSKILRPYIDVSALKNVPVPLPEN